MAKFLREPHGGAKRAKHRAKRSPECGDPAKQGHAQSLLSFIFLIMFFLNTSGVDVFVIIGYWVAGKCLSPPHNVAARLLNIGVCITKI
jgi:hypothetical protein